MRRGEGTLQGVLGIVLTTLSTLGVTRPMAAARSANTTPAMMDTHLVRLKVKGCMITMITTMNGLYDHNAS